VTIVSDVLKKEDEDGTSCQILNDLPATSIVYVEGEGELRACDFCVQFGKFIRKLENK